VSKPARTDDRTICGAEVEATIPGINVGFEINNRGTVMRTPGLRDDDINGIVLIPRPKVPPTLIARVTFVCKLHPDHRGPHVERFAEAGSMFTWLQKVAPEDIDDAIDAWHESDPSNNMELHEWLGMTADEYAAFVEQRDRG
jgi:hypothetical protein